MREKTDSFGELDQAAQLRDAPWPATKDELIEFAARNGAALQLLDELYALPDGDHRYTALETVLMPLQLHQYSSYLPDRPPGGRDRGVA